MTRVFSSVREAYIGILSGEVEPVPSTSTKSKRAASYSGTSPSNGVKWRSGLLTQSPKTVKKEHQEEPSEWRVSVRTISDEDSHDDRKKEIDTSTLSQEDLRSLQKSDPFLYYSIPSIRRSSYLFGKGDDVDTIRRSSLPIMQHNHLDQHTSSQVLVQEQAKRRESIVRRTSRISTEAHPGLIYDDILSELPSLDGDVEGMDDLFFLSSCSTLGSV